MKNKNCFLGKRCYIIIDLLLKLNRTAFRGNIRVPKKLELAGSQIGLSNLPPITVIMSLGVYTA